MADIGASNWSETDANNSSAAPDGAPENMAAAGVNDTMRAMMGATKRFYDWSIPKATAGSSTVYTLSYSVAPGALVDGMTHFVVFHAANGAAPTLNVNGLGAVPLHIMGPTAWGAPAAGAIPVNSYALVAYSSSAGTYRLVRNSGAGVWTASDASGAGVAFTSVSCSYQVSGTWCHCSFLYTYSANGSGASASFTLPVAANSTYGGTSGILDVHSGGFNGLVRVTQGSAVASLLNSAGNALTNTTMGGLTVSGTISYPI